MFRPRVKLFIQSSLTNNANGRFILNFNEPIRNVVNISIYQIIIKPFIGLNNYNSIFLRSDLVVLNKNINMFNGKPQTIASMIPVINNSAYFKSDYIDDQKTSPRNIDSCWFELWGDGITLLNPPDGGWNFCIELQLTTENEQLVGNGLY